MRHVALFLLWSLIASAQTTKPEAFSTIQGSVINAATGEPVGKASLLLMPTGAAQTSSSWTGSYSAVSGPAGKFAIRNVAPGQYRLRISRNGFLTVEYGARALQRSGTVLDLNSPRQMKDLEIRLTPDGVIAGRVLDADGEPLEGARVQLLRSRYVNGKKVLATTTTAYTNDLGEYRCYGLTPGKYYIYAENLEGLPPSSDAPEIYVPIYYPGAADAVPLDVGAGAQVRAADMMLRKAPTATVKGRVVVDLPGAQGLPSVDFFPETGHDNSSATSYRVYPAKVSAAGEFEIRALALGTYSVMAQIGKGGLAYTSPPMKLEVAGSQDRRHRSPHRPRHRHDGPDPRRGRYKARFAEPERKARIGRSRRELVSLWIDSRRR